MKLTKQHKHVLMLLLEVLPVFLAWLSRTAKALNAKQIASIRAKIRRFKSAPSMQNAVTLAQSLQQAVSPA